MTQDERIKALQSIWIVLDECKDGVVNTDNIKCAMEDIELMLKDEEKK